MAFARNKQTRPFVEQWARTGRWFERLKTAYASSDQEAPADDVMDLFYSLFQNCFAMRDWLENSGVDRRKVDDLFNREALQLCRDIANGTKHCEITHNPVDPAFVTTSEHDPVLKSAGSNRIEVLRLLASEKNTICSG